MGLFKRLIKNVFRDGQSRVAPSSFDNLSEQQIEEHMRIARYGSFVLSDAIRPSVDLQITPRSGFRRDAYKDKETGVEIPVIMASASKETLFDLFLELLDPLGDEVDVVLETSHDRKKRGHDDLYREHIDLPVLKSTLCEFEDLLLNDGCTGIAVLNPGIPLEVQFDEHKLLIVYGQDLEEFARILEDSGIEHDENLRFLTEAEHIHSSSEELRHEFSQLRYRLAIEEDADRDRYSWNDA
ncbi:MAG: hypothetical protein NT069_08950 [Planctomycetota bacterium]|nr:hypothetical protein [Planctomycetota bacterium]